MKKFYIIHILKTVIWDNGGMNVTVSRPGDTRLAVMHEDGDYSLHLPLYVGREQTVAMSDYIEASDFHIEQEINGKDARAFLERAGVNSEKCLEWYINPDICGDRVYTVVAGKYEDGDDGVEENIKFSSEEIKTIEEARKIERAYHTSYWFSRIELHERYKG